MQSLIDLLAYKMSFAWTIESFEFYCSLSSATLMEEELFSRLSKSLWPLLESLAFSLLAKLDSYVIVSF